MVEDGLEVDESCSPDSSLCFPFEFAVDVDVNDWIEGNLSAAEVGNGGGEASGSPSLSTSFDCFPSFAVAVTCSF